MAQGRSWLARLLNVGLWLVLGIWRRVRPPQSVTALKSRADTATQLSTTPHKKSIHSMAGLHRAHNLLIIAELSIPQCRKYRVDQKMQALVHLDAGLASRSQVISWTDTQACMDALQTSSMVIFYRTPAFEPVLAMHAEAKRLGQTTFYDIDDLVFDVEEYARNQNVKVLPDSEREQLLHGGMLYAQMLQTCDHAIASTPVIALYMRRFTKGQVFLIENAMDAQLLRLSAEVGVHAKTYAHSHTPSPGDWVDIVYGSGTRTHDADFAIAAPALLKILQQFAQTRLVLYGPLQISEQFQAFGERVLRVGFLQSDDYYRALARADICIAPLESSIFNDAKSNIKYLEASVFARPSVCADADAFRSVITAGVDGFLAQTSEQWFEALASLVQDAKLRDQMGARAKSNVFKRYAPEITAHQYLKPVLDLGLPPQEAKRVGVKRVMIVNILFAPTSFGGATLVAEQLALGIHAQPDFEAMVFCANLQADQAPGSLRSYVWKDIPVLSMGLRLGGTERAHEYDHPMVTQTFEKVLAAYKPDVVHFHSIQSMGIGMARACQAQGVPYAITLHDAWWLCERQFMVKADHQYCGQKAVNPAVCASCIPDTAFNHQRFFQLQKTLAGAARLFAPSQFHRQLHIDSGIAEQKIHLNKNGIHLPSADAAKKIRANHVNRAERPLVFAYLGGTGRHKGYAWLQALMPRIKASNYVLRLVDVESRFGGSHIHAKDWPIAGQLDIVAPFEPHEVDAFFSDVDVLLFPSQCKESFGLTVREALSRHVWVICTDCGGPAEEIAEGINGHLVAMHDQQGFQGAVEKLLAQPARLEQYVNPHTAAIRSYGDQSHELCASYRELLKHQ
jgi:O-antigen biosynthesis protein